MCLTLKGSTGYLGHPFLHQEHMGVHEEQERGFSSREGCFSRLFPVPDSAKQEARLLTDLVPCVCETQPASLRAREEEKDMPKTPLGSRA
jgi:hypothetical protein